MSRARDLSQLANENALSVNDTTYEVGINSTSPDADLNVGGTIKMDGPSGVITATSYEGSGANLTGIAATDTIAAASLTVSGISTLTGVVKALSDVRVTGNLNAGIGTFSGILKGSSDVRITGNINAGISTLSGKAIVGAVTLQHSDIVAGVVTATSYKGSGADLTGLPAGFSWIEGNLF